VAWLRAVGNRARQSALGIVHVWNTYTPPVVLNLERGCISHDSATGLWTITGRKFKGTVDNDGNKVPEAMAAHPRPPASPRCGRHLAPAGRRDPAGLSRRPTRDAPLVRAMIAATDPITGRALTDDEIRNELIVFMLAGHHTTATTLSYALWALGHHPDMQDRIRVEAAAIGDRELTPDDVPRLAYTVRVLHEALRVCPPGPSIPRMITHDIEVDGHLVKAGTGCAVGVYAMHRDPALWDHPLQFNPDRFTPENTKGRDRWQYIPFSAGPRTCIGDHFAMLEATLALATIIRRTEIRSLNNDFPLAFPFTMVAAAPIRAQVTARTSA
jgi:cytochrome P450